jgi:aldose 1-epimerase
VLHRSGSVRQVADGVSVELWATASFRELVVFTPPHRQAICLEPYTCTTDAINQQQRTIDAGLIVLEPAAEWQGVVELRAPVLTAR